MKKIIFILILAVLSTGCASKKFAVKKGMTKEQVIAIMGEPDLIKNSDNSCCKEENEESWHYFLPLKRFGKRRSILFVDDVVKFIFKI